MDSVEEKHISPPPMLKWGRVVCEVVEVDGGYGNEFGFDNQPRPVAWRNKGPGLPPVAGGTEAGLTNAV